MTYRNRVWLLVFVFVFVVMMLVACQSKTEEVATVAAPAATEEPKVEAPAATKVPKVEAPTATEEPKVEAPTAAVETEEPLIIAFGYASTIDDGSFDQMNYSIQQAVEEHFGDRVKVVYAEMIPFSEEAARTFEQFVASGATFLVDLWDFADATEEVAARHPETMMEKYGGWVGNENQHGYWFVDGEMAFLHGVAAGLLTKTNQLGYLGPWPAAYVKAGLNAFTLGAQSVNPDVTVHAVMYGSFYDPPACRQATEALISSGVDVVSGYIVEPTAHMVAEEAGVWVTGGQEGPGIEGSNEAFAPNTFVTATFLDFRDYFIERVQMALDGTWVGNMETTIVPIGGGVDLAKFGSKVPQDVVDKVLEVRQQFIDGENPFVGPIYDNTGAIIVAEGEYLTKEDFWMGLEWVVQGATGMEE